MGSELTTTTQDLLSALVEKQIFGYSGQLKMAQIKAI